MKKFGLVITMLIIPLCLCGCFRNSKSEIQEYIDKNIDEPCTFVREESHTWDNGKVQYDYIYKSNLRDFEFTIHDSVEPNFSTYRLSDDYRLSLEAYYSQKYKQYLESNCTLNYRYEEDAWNVYNFEIDVNNSTEKTECCNVIYEYIKLMNDNINYNSTFDLSKLIAHIVVNDYSGDYKKTYDVYIKGNQTIEDIEKQLY